MSTHAPLAPSSAYIWGNCSGFRQAAQDVPNFETEHSRLGDATHWVSSDALELARRGRTAPAVNWVDGVAPNGVVIDEDMAEGVQVYIDDVLDTAAKHGQMGSIMIERRVEMPSIHPKNWGTFDSAIYVRSIDTIFLWDYKNGRSPVKAEGNLQLTDYANGLYEELRDEGASENTKIVFRIVQPNCFSGKGPVDEWSGVIKDLFPAWGRLINAAHESYNNPTLTPGAHCKYCPANGKCSAARLASYSIADYLQSPYAIDIMSGPELATERQALLEVQAMLKGRIDDIDANLIHRIKSGEAGTGLALQAGQGRSKWVPEVGVVEALGRQFDAEFTVQKPLTPTQARALLPKSKKAMFDTVAQSMTTRPPTALKLIEAADSKVSRAFKKRV